MNIHTEKKVSLSKNISFVMFASIFRQFLSLFSGIVVARILLPQDFGIISMAATFSGLIDVFSKFGMETFIISRQNLSKTDINSVYLLNILAGIVFAIIMIIISPVIANIYRTPEVKYILFFAAISLLITSFISIPRALLIKNMRQDVVSKIEIVQSLLNVGLIIVFALLGFRYLSYVIPLLIVNSASCIIYLVITGWKFSIDFSKDIFSQTFAYSKSFLPKTILTFFVYNSDYIFIGYLLGPTLLGYYFFGFDKASILVGLLVGLHCNIFFPIFSKLQANKNDLKTTFFSLMEKQAFIVYPLIFAQIMLAKELINLIYGARWDNSILIFQLILGYIFVRITASIIHVLFDAVNMPQQNLKHFLLITPICLVAFFIGIKLGNLKGVVIAAFVAHLFASFLLFIRVCFVFKWDFSEFLSYLSKFFIPIILQIPVIIPLKLYLNYLTLPDYITILIMVPIIFTLYIFLTSLFLKDFYNNVVEPTRLKILSIIGDKLVMD
ncbi:MAG: hypothetical protein A2255_00510 [Candidatus Melainabacteria bacterium RIFOXYA2_FULL_32_9]|nr:MAG: hypothetical protein A2255_00510 [Candidatus Melainabacteria bacterium RIFOXYA2_FULL_32_9]